MQCVSPRYSKRPEVLASKLEPDITITRSILSNLYHSLTRHSLIVSTSFRSVQLSEPPEFNLYLYICTLLMWVFKDCFLRA